ncbi:MAG: hypothetical protein HIU93_10480 [Acidobacteria bacterium]|nr:hypothetical protein [Acidobacteriota bacterium]MBW4046226.1 hypothetical protein [Acidobacteriota bacterium]
MQPSELNTMSFETYPAQARALAVGHLPLLQSLPLALLPLLLREVIAYDWRFPAERAEIDEQINYLQGLAASQRAELMRGFAAIKLPAELTQVDWVNQPQNFSEQLTAYLWSTHQIDGFRKAASEYGNAVSAATPVKPPETARLGIAVIGKGVQTTDYPIFRKLKAHGTLFTQVDPAGGLATLIDAVNTRAQAHPGAYRHWYIDGGEAMAGAAAGVTQLSYAGIAPTRRALIGRMQTWIDSGKMGPELLRTKLAALGPADLGMKADGERAVMGRFEISLLTEGSGTQIFATTFAQWAAREAWRRAQPETLLVRFGPRQRQRSMNETLLGTDTHEEPDFEGSLIDADMGAYYTWIDQQRLAGAQQGAFVAWFEGHGQAVAIGPGLPAGSTSEKPATFRQVMEWVS